VERFFVKYIKDMSRIGLKPIEIPKDVEVKIDKRNVIVKGPKGQLERKIRPEIGIEEKDGNLELRIVRENKRSNAFLGLERSLVANMVEGVSKGFEKTLELHGVGYRARMEGETLVIEVGFSHPVEMNFPDEDIDVQIEKGKIKVSGIDKAKVGRIAAKIRDVRPPEPYKGKGIRYEGEEIIKKEGKKAVGSE